VPLKKLTEGKHATGGRNHYGRITSRFRGGGHKQRYRIVDFKRAKIGIPARVAEIEYDPNRTARIALLHYADGEKTYILAPDGLKQGDTVLSSRLADIRPGNCLPLGDIPAGTMIHNIEMRKGKGGQMVRSAGTAAQLMAKDSTYAQVKLPSGEVRKIHVLCRATVGQVSNLEHQNISLGKAGRARWLGRRPHNRGVTMNPVDHPMGGGEGRTSGGRHPCSPWGQLSKGLNTRNNKRTDSMIVKHRKAKG
ncbi:MAG TPA: 50S ribosomal protein L2, partial [Polyangiaceae bacterium]